MTDIQLVSGEPVPEDRSHTEINPRTGMQKDYVVLTPEERAKGFVKPLRRSYMHNGAVGPKHPLRDLTADEMAQYAKYNYYRYEEYPQPHNLCGKYWTKAQLDRVEKPCGTVTTMSLAIAETYARKPDFYSGTFCCGCGTHYPLEEFTWEPDGEPMEPSLQEAWHASLKAKVGPTMIKPLTPEQAEGLRKTIAVFESTREHRGGLIVPRAEQQNAQQDARIAQLERRVKALEDRLRGVD